MSADIQIKSPDAIAPPAPAPTVPEVWAAIQRCAAAVKETVADATTLLSQVRTGQPVMPPALSALMKKAASCQLVCDAGLRASFAYAYRREDWERRGQAVDPELAEPVLRHIFNEAKRVQHIGKLYENGGHHTPRGKRLYASCPDCQDFQPLVP